MIDTPTRIFINPRTRLLTLWRVESGWEAFTACPDPRAAYKDMLGTSMLLRDNGTACRIVRRHDHDDFWEFYP